MKKCYICFLLFSFGFCVNAQNQNMPYMNQKPWNVLFEDNFDYFNNTLWNKANNTTHGLGVYEEPQIYTSENVFVDNGKLVLRTVSLDYSIPHPNNDTCQYRNHHTYTSGEIMSINKYQYGYYEIYAKLPTSEGYWPAFWFHADNHSITDPWYNEIDVFECKGSDATKTECGCWYSFTYPFDLHQTNFYSDLSFDYSAGYHWYGVYWSKDSIIWYYDRQPIQRVKNDFDGIGVQNPMKLIVNIALTPTAWGDNIITDNSIFPNYMYVDKINGYQLNCDDKNIEINEIYDFENYNYSIKKSISLTGATIIPQNDNIDLYASDYLELNYGFSVPLGTSFSFEITEDCE